MLRAAKSEIALARLAIAVEQHRLRPALASGPHNQRILLPLDHPRIVGPGSVRGRHATLVFLDAPADFAVQRLDQLRLRLLERRCHIGIFRIEIRPDVIRQRLRPLHHLLPVRRPQPRIGIVAGDVKLGDGMRAARRDGRLGKGLEHDGTDIGACRRSRHPMS